jgi:hypothetical protein
MSITYGRDVAPFSSDEYISLAEAAMESFAAAGNPGAFYVDLFPSCKSDLWLTCRILRLYLAPVMYIPEWLMPSWAFKKKASVWKPTVTYFKEKPYEEIRQSMVCPDNTRSNDHITYVT